MSERQQCYPSFQAFEGPLHKHKNNEKNLISGQLHKNVKLALIRDGISLISALIHVKHFSYFTLLPIGHIFYPPVTHSKVDYTSVFLFLEILFFSVY